MAVFRKATLYAAGSPLLCDYEQTLQRLGVELQYVVRNVEGGSYASDPSSSIDVAHAGSDVFENAIFIPLFTPAMRAQARAELSHLDDAQFPALIDPTAILPSNLKVGPGTFINSGAILGSHCEIGRFSVINRGANLGHHAQIGDFVSIGPGVTLAGCVTIQNGATIGAGAVLLPEVHIGKGAIVGAGAVVTKDVAENVLVVGNPAHVVQAKSSERFADGDASRSNLN